MSHKVDYLKDDINKLFMKFLIPSIAGSVMVSMYILFDTIFVGRGVGSEGLAALNISIPIYNVLFAVGLLMGVGGATAMSVSIGQRKYDKVNDIFTYSVVAAFLIGALITIFGTIFIDELCYFLGANEENVYLVKQYLRVVILFSTSFIMVNTLSVFIRSDKAPKLAMWGTAIGSVLNIVLDAVFIFTFGWGMKGAAIATVISSVLSLCFLIYFHFIRGNSRLRLVKPRFELQLVKRIGLNGIPSFIIEVSSGIVIFAFNNVLESITGTIGISAYSIIANISLICVAIFTGVAQAIQPIISINFGAEKYNRVNRVVRLGVMFSGLFGILFFTTGLLFPRQIVSLFNTDSIELMNITVRGISIYFIGFIIMGLNIALGAFYQAIEYSMFSMVISVSRGIGFILIGLLTLPRLLAADGVWITVPFAEAATLVLAAAFFVRVKKAIRNSEKAIA
ncbi:MATE family efflux transporter [Clostridium swellfunianum]|uniref:MATE family efflux transporter n=1 Tax=Clostridium swellfunianum TaxID=1367462 RepID=UPI00202E3C27|nr:MATE family efflux transporter [Clostridium swellfunianum]MCM0649162.1 MATE family efflux transporter [Clostridium swellfunianum]